MKIHKILSFLGLVSFSVTICSCSVNKGLKYDNVYLIMGQSNASGNSPYRFLEVKKPDIYNKFSNGGVKNVLTTYDNYFWKDEEFKPTTFAMADQFWEDGPYSFGPEVGIADILSAKKETSYIIKAACSGTSLSHQWLDVYGNKNELYEYMINFIKKQMQLLIDEGKIR